MVGGGKQIIANSGPITGGLNFSKAHVVVAQWNTEVWWKEREPKLWMQMKGHPVWTSPNPVPGKPQSPHAGVKPIKMSEQKHLSGASFSRVTV